ncbi:predicted protein [Sclerotinia sclerotiorum 1980 UF-70]|uniref:J domain-containing protein n=1 Tax=Sclerotinia sclerotiorum (strain ATCC 18683 / 1980 / Ss-1) TaxID=665079 RepID=A7EZY1_SCLS1|nr:predicted protein [Sclerotinia sclerotiorum 1980 UF-70]EDN95023.1 predicted protein [Sclerotinia sclerotiorum 1980 UF-70]
MDPVTILGAASSAIGIASFGLQLVQVLTKYTTDAGAAAQNLNAALTNIRAASISIEHINHFLKEESERSKLRQRATLNTAGIRQIQYITDECLKVFWRVEAWVLDKDDSNELELRIANRLNEYKEDLKFGIGKPSQFLKVDEALAKSPQSYVQQPDVYRRENPRLRRFVPPAVPDDPLRSSISEASRSYIKEQELNCRNTDGQQRDLTAPEHVIPSGDATINAAQSHMAHFDAKATQKPGVLDDLDACDTNIYPDYSTMVEKPEEVDNLSIVAQQSQKNFADFEHVGSDGKLRGNLDGKAQYPKTRECGNTKPGQTTPLMPPKAPSSESPGIMPASLSQASSTECKPHRPQISKVARPDIHMNNLTKRHKPSDLRHELNTAAPSYISLQAKRPKSEAPLDPKLEVPGSDYPKNNITSSNSNNPGNLNDSTHRTDNVATSQKQSSGFVINGQNQSRKLNPQPVRFDFSFEDLAEAQTRVVDEPENPIVPQVTLNDEPPRGNPEEIAQIVTNKLLVALPAIIPSQSQLGAVLNQPEHNIHENCAVKKDDIPKERKKLFTPVVERFSENINREPQIETTCRSPPSNLPSSVDSYSNHKSSKSGGLKGIFRGSHFTDDDIDRMVPEAPNSGLDFRYTPTRATASSSGKGVTFNSHVFEDIILRAMEAGDNLTVLQQEQVQLIVNSENEVNGGIAWTLAQLEVVDGQYHSPGSDGTESITVYLVGSSKLETDLTVKSDKSGRSISPSATLDDIGADDIRVTPNTKFTDFTTPLKPSQRIYPEFSSRGTKNTEPGFMNSPKSVIKASYISEIPNAESPSHERESHNHYVSLQIPTYASAATIRDAYLSLYKTSHPILHPTDYSAGQRFVAITEAYETLGTARTREAYDRKHGFNQPPLERQPIDPKKNAYPAVKLKESASQHGNHRENYAPSKSKYDGRRAPDFVDHGRSPLRAGHRASEAIESDPSPLRTSVHGVLSAHSSAERALVNDGRPSSTSARKAFPVARTVTENVNRQKRYASNNPGVRSSRSYNPHDLLGSEHAGEDILQQLLLKWTPAGEESDPASKQSEEVNIAHDPESENENKQPVEKQSKGKGPQQQPCDEIVGGSAELKRLVDGDQNERHCHSRYKRPKFCKYTSGSIHSSISTTNTPPSHVSSSKDTTLEVEVHIPDHLNAAQQPIQKEMEGRIDTPDTVKAIGRRPMATVEDDVGDSADFKNPSMFPRRAMTTMF